MFVNLGNWDFLKCSCFIDLLRICHLSIAKTIISAKSYLRILSSSWEICDASVYFIPCIISLVAETKYMTREVYWKKGLFQLQFKGCSPLKMEIHRGICLGLPSYYIHSQGGHNGQEVELCYQTKWGQHSLPLVGLYLLNVPQTFITAPAIVNKYSDT